ncbi:hypothetical protein [Methanobrevibacter oralis]|uniref:hypothetical protein n=1 Tax=Methanobrevibacter oralis TaxID=66851 RepID=UPI000A94B022|nr:hypothetical protein [Methanobrevibacter oralis]
MFNWRANGRHRLKKIKTKKYKCHDCGNTFKGLGKKVVCPSCQSDNVTAEE